MRSREHYEATKANRKTRQQEKRQATEEAAQESALRKLWFWRHPDKIIRYTGWLQAYTLILSISTIVLAVVTGISAVILANTDKHISDQLEEARDELIIAHPPRFLLNGVKIFPPGQRDNIPTINPGQKLDGEAALINAGTWDAWIERSKCMVYWHLGPLPMARPYDNDETYINQCVVDVNPPDPSFQKRRIQGENFKSGDMAIWKFSTIVPSESNQNLYVLGYVIYRSTLSTGATTRHDIAFSRRYDPAKSRFIAVTNYHDYENEE